VRFAVFAIALVVRLAAIELTGATKTAFGDAADYIAHAQSICEKHAYPDRGNLPFFRAPGLPFFIAAVTACHPHEVRLIKYGLAVCDAVTAVIIALLALHFFGSVAAWIAGLIAAIHPVFVASVCDIRSEPLFMLLLTLAILFLLRGREPSAGVATALAALTRPSALLCIPLFALYRPRRAVAFVTAAVLTLAPWVARNFLRYGELIPVNDAGGFSFWRGSAPETIAIAHEENREKYRELAYRFDTDVVTEMRVDIERVATTPGARSREWLRRGIENIRRDPATQWKFIAEKAWLYWRPFLSPMEYSQKVVAASTIFFIGLYVLGLIGLIRGGGQAILPVLLFFAAMWLAHLPYQISMRLRVPLVDPLMITFAAGELYRRYEHAGKSDRPDAPRTA
jgi:4-amino-4-deoxy-L-arabinose transferase-like glycosyltransferase